MKRIILENTNDPSEAKLSCFSHRKIKLNYPRIYKVKNDTFFSGCGNSVKNHIINFFKNRTFYRE